MALTLGLAVSAVSSAALVGSVLKLDGTTVVGRLLTNAVITRIGSYTYASYIWHWPVESAARKLGLDHLAFYEFFGSRLVGQLAYWALLLAITVGIAALSWHLVETRCLRLKRHFPYRMAT